MPRRPEFWSDDRGTTAVEFAMVVSVLLALTLGAINTGLVLFAQSALHYAVDDTARCMSVKTNCNISTLIGGVPTLVPNNTLTINYAKTVYHGPNIGQTFTPQAAQACGNQVSGTGTFNLNAVLVNLPITLNATACFPVSS